jgi:hypothetical protein
MNKLMLGLLTFSALGFMSLPAVAGDSVDLDEVNSRIVITGNGNNATHDIRTTTVDLKNGQISGDEGRVSRIDALSDILGDDNDTGTYIERHQRRIRQR